MYINLSQNICKYFNLRKRSECLISIVDFSFGMLDKDNINEAWGAAILKPFYLYTKKDFHFNVL